MRQPLPKWPKNITSVYESWKPLFYLCNYFLFTRYPTSSGEKLSSFTTFPIVRFAVLALTCVFIAITNTLSSTSRFHILSPTYSPVEAIAGRLVNSLGSVTAIVLWILSKILQKRFELFIQKTNELDNKVGPMVKPLMNAIRFWYDFPDDYAQVSSWSQSRIPGCHGPCLSSLPNFPRCSFHYVSNPIILQFMGNGTGIFSNLRYKWTNCNNQPQVYPIYTRCWNEIQRPE